MKKIASLIVATVLIAAGLLPGKALAASAILFLSPSSANLPKDSILTVQVRENSGTEPVNGVQANLSYHPSLLDFIGIDNSPAFPIIAEASGGGGSVRIGRGTITPVTGSQLVAAVKFKIKKDAGPIGISFVEGSAVTSADGHGTNILSGTAGGNYNSGAESTPGPAPGPATIAPESKPPPAPKADTVKVAGQNVPVTGDQPIKTEPNKPLVLSGVTIPNGIVTLYVYSEPKKYTTMADKDGNWSYTVTDLEPGDHRVEVEVTDPVTNKTSERKELLKFTVPAAIPSYAILNTNNKVPLWYLLAAVPLALALGASGYWFVHRRQAHSAPQGVHSKTHPDSQEPGKTDHPEP